MMVKKVNKMRLAEYIESMSGVKTKRHYYILVFARRKGFRRAKTIFVAHHYARQNIRRAQSVAQRS
ncbi:unnamed protein product [Prunus armeniaca]